MREFNDYWVVTKALIARFTASIWLKKLRATRVRTVLKRCVRIILVCTVLSLTGCQQAAFRAGSLPPEYMAAAVTNSQQLDLARLSSSMGGTDRIYPGDMISVAIVTGIREIDEQSGWKLRVSETIFN